MKRSEALIGLIGTALASALVGCGAKTNQYDHIQKDSEKTVKEAVVQDSDEKGKELLQKLKEKYSQEYPIEEQNEIMGEEKGCLGVYQLGDPDATEDTVDTITPVIYEFDSSENAEKFMEKDMRKCVTGVNGKHADFEVMKKDKDNNPVYSICDSKKITVKGIGEYISAGDMYYRRGNLVFQVMGYNKLDGEPSDYNVYRDGLLRIVDM